MQQNKSNEAQHGINVQQNIRMKGKSHRKKFGLYVVIRGGHVPFLPLFFCSSLFFFCWSRCSEAGSGKTGKTNNCLAAIRRSKTDFLRVLWAMAWYYFDRSVWEGLQVPEARGRATGRTGVDK